MNQEKMVVHKQIDAEEREIPASFREILPKITRNPTRSLYDVERKARKWHKIITGVLKDGEQLPQTSGRKEALESKADRLKKIYLILWQTRLECFQKNVVFSEGETAFRRSVRTGIVGNIGYIDPIGFFEESKEHLTSFVNSALEELKTMKAHLVFCGYFNLKGEKSEMKHFKTAYDVILRSSDLNNWYETSVNSLIDQMVEFEGVGSGWSLEEIVSLKAIITKADLLNGASFIRLPKYISHKKAVVNIECSADENDCFAWCIMAHLFPLRKRSPRQNKRESYPPHEKVLNSDGMTFPVRLIDIPKFEGLNNQISVNVFQISEEKQIHPVYLTFDEKIQHVNLLLLHDGEKSHYCYIRHSSRLISSQISSHGHVTFTCDTCFHCFPTRDKLQEHKANCSEINDCSVILPNGNEKTLKFKNHRKKESIHSIVYADFECLLTQYNYEQVNDRSFELNNVYEDDKENIPPQESPNATFSDYGKYAKLKKSKIVGKAFQRHVPYSAGLYYHDRYEAGKSYYTSFRGRNCTTLFAQELERITEVVQRVSIRIGTRKS
ncbi:hypothetical protein QAD02_003078 [Eretmocerus hayati]|uniref:Uncharacterized protein n=1 Tax=Eretmocerus hayati TaxID=131215 RepID=A0ACC2NL39_9HYME|nr:hypothetical protein QAD02_003078 [Eretmocerus hayati]